MDDLSTTGAEEQTIVIVPEFTHRMVEIKVDVKVLNADIEQARAALERVGVNLSESIREAMARIGLDIASSVFCSPARGLPAVERFEPVETWMRRRRWVGPALLSVWLKTRASKKRV